MRVGERRPACAGLIPDDTSLYYGAGMTPAQLLVFIERTMKTQEIYQPVVIAALLEAGDRQRSGNWRWPCSLRMKRKLMQPQRV